MSAKITLITGVPGSGKTAGAVDLIMREYADRPLFNDGLNGLTLAHVPCNVESWHTEIPDGAVVVVDEVQRRWRPRSSTAKVPMCIEALETHRHRGIDFIVMTQNPKLVDGNVRNLCGRHIHLRDTGWMGRWWYEWPECSETVAWKSCTNKHRYRIPRHVFDKYKSASMHVKAVGRKPLLYYAIPFALLTIGYLAYRFWASRQAPDPAPVVATATANPVSTVIGSPTASTTGDVPVQRLADERVDFIPRISSRPWTAPAYDTLRKVSYMPSITASMCINDKCTCYDGSRKLAEVSSKDCADWTANKPFNPYRAAPDAVPDRPPTSASAASPM